MKYRIALIVTLYCIASMALQQLFAQSASTQVDFTHFHSSLLDTLLVEKANTYRKKVQLTSACLSEAASHHSNWMLKHKRLSHDETGSTLSESGDRVRYFCPEKYKSYGEIVYMMQSWTDRPYTYMELADKIFNSYRSSPGHNKILKDKDFDYGCFSSVVRVYRGKVYLYNTGLFATF